MDSQSNTSNEDTTLNEPPKTKVKTVTKNKLESSEQHSLIELTLEEWKKHWL